jgi:hypothetical protein
MYASGVAVATSMPAFGQVCVCTLIIFTLQKLRWVKHYADSKLHCINTTVGRFW